jgi:hypothetical protein
MPRRPEVCHAVHVPPTRPTHAPLRLALCFVTALGCGDDPASSLTGQVQPDLSDQVYDPQHLLQVEIEMAPAEWDTLREQGFSLFEFQSGEVGEFDYTFFDAAVTIDGERLTDVSVRKKGGLGSLSRHRPSLILDLDHNVEGQTHRSVKRLTLNNDKGNTAHNRQCMALELFTLAGLPASRCNLAHVTLNGQDLGTYSNVEPIRKPFLARHFADAEGNLYEGHEDGDFTAEGVERFQIKTNEDDNDRSDLRAVERALAADDSSVVEELSKVIDLDQFRRFWALETLTGNWDSYSGNTNNFYIYHDPTSDRFVFLPWSPDTAFTGGSPIDAYNETLTVYATSAIPNRLYNLPQERARFRELLAELNDTLWDTPALLSRLDELANLSTDAWPGAIEQQRNYLSTYSQRLRDELALEAPEWRLGGIDLTDPTCAGQLGAASGRFETTWIEGPLPFEPGHGEFQVTLEVSGQTLEATWFGASGRDPAGGGRGSSVLLLGALADGRVAFIQLNTGNLFAAGIEPFYSFETFGFVGLINTDGTLQLLGVLSEGQIDFESAGTRAGEPVVGTFEGQVYQTSCFE